MCRECADIVMDCRTKTQPLECSDYCISYKVGLELKRMRATTCALPSNISNGFVHPHSNASTHIAINTTVTISCKEGFSLHGVKTKTCLGDDKWTKGEFPYCLHNSYILNLWKIYQRRINKQRMVSLTSPAKSYSSVKSGTDSFEQNEFCTLIDNETLTQNQQEDAEEETEKKAEYLTYTEAEGSSQSSNAVPSKPPTDLNPDSYQGMSSNPVVNNTVTVSLHLINERESTTQHQADQSKYKEEKRADRRDNKSEEKQPKENLAADKTPVKESQETVQALQETQKGIPSEDAKPLHLQNENDFARNEPNLVGYQDRAFAATGSRTKQVPCPIT
ncbi:uncharacterized protein LOC123551242 [Mercenaria mercenaria]|uniref:uncharacterized protein LOC123551242 n=1 Tax=Mercenaria mercenaria TaxID=6596 RepID=UPI00234FB41C|nr:uncharacterized protein LOC123551242 [Mercenaria mercenaria]